MKGRSRSQREAALMTDSKLFQTGKRPCFNPDIGSFAKVSPWDFHVPTSVLLCSLLPLQTQMAPEKHGPLHARPGCWTLLQLHPKAGLLQRLLLCGYPQTQPASDSITMNCIQQGFAVASFFLHLMEAQCDHHMASKCCNTPELQVSSRSPRSRFKASGALSTHVLSHLMLTFRPAVPSDVYPSHCSPTAQDTAGFLAWFF